MKNVKVVKTVEKEVTKFMENYFESLLIFSVQFSSLYVRYEWFKHTHTGHSKFKPVFFHCQFVIAIYLSFSQSSLNKLYVCILCVCMRDYVCVCGRLNSNELQRNQIDAKQQIYAIISIFLHFYNLLHRFKLNSMRASVWGPRSSSHSHKWLETIFGSITS